MFPNETHKLGEMEFYLLEDLDFHLTVFHPYRSILHMTGREPADGGKFPQSRVDEDLEIRKREADTRRKKEDEARKSGPAGSTKVALALDEVNGLNPGGGGAGKWEESEEARIRRLMGRGSGEGLMEVDEGVLQIGLSVHYPFTRQYTMTGRRAGTRR
jgi:cyclin C